MNQRLQAVLLLSAALSASCASSVEPRLPGTVAGSSRGVIAPGQTVVTQPQGQVFGTPSNIPEPIRAPFAAQPAFATPVDMDALYGYEGQGRQGMAEGDPTKAEFNFERALEVNPFDAVALNNLAVAKAERGQFYDAMAMLERAAKLAPDNSDIVANLARLRGYVQSYATAGVEASSATPVRNPAGSKLPPVPPPLWAGSRYVQPVYERATAPRPMAASAGDDYESDACRRQPGKNGKVEVVCEPLR
ncbi:MAG: tetratricopeptide repeat protein [Pseudomonadota bacterium]